MSITIEKKKELRGLTTLQIGGFAENFVVVETEEALQEAVAYAKHHSLEIKILGGGSNVLIADGEIKGLVIHMCIAGTLDTSWTQIADTIQLSAKAGEVFDDVVAYSVEQNWWGLENLSHIPGSVGATPVQNVGAYGVEVKDIITSVRVYNIQTDTFETLTASACKFMYRDSLFKKEEGRKYIVTEVTYELSQAPCPKLAYRDLQTYFQRTTSPTITQVREAVIAIRSKKFPDWHEVGTAGSFFKNPVVSSVKFEELRAVYPELPGYTTEDGSIKIALGWLLDKVLAIKGVQEGNVGTYKEQALVLVNHKGASATEIENFADMIVAKIADRTGVHVEWEVTKFL